MIPESGGTVLNYQNLFTFKKSMILATSLTVLGAVVSLVSSCAARPPKSESALLFGTQSAPPQVDASASEPADRGWLARTIHILHAGRRTTQEDVIRFVGRPKGEVVDELIADSAFASMVLDFGMTFLGAAPQPNRELGSFLRSYDPRNVFDSTNGTPLHAAVQYAVGGEFFSLLDQYPASYVLKLLPPERNPEIYRKDYGLPDLGDLENLLTGTDSSIRRAIIVYLASRVESLKTRFEEARQQPGGDEKALTFLCSDFRQSSPKSPAGPLGPLAVETSRFRAAGTLMGLQGWFTEIFAQSGSGFFEACDPETQSSIGGRLEAVNRSFAKVSDFLKRAPEILADLEERSAKAGAGLASLLPVDLRQFPKSSNFDLSFPVESGPLGFNFYQSHPNSSTNFNRKRAAAVLKRYFCDDLIPLQVVLPSAGLGHAEGRHASDPACQSCHYKLDPMAGFFRSRGVVGLEFVNPNEEQRRFLEESRKDLRLPPEIPVGQFLVFDDQAVVSRDDLDRYLGSWRFSSSTNKPAGAEWNVGFIRSAIQPEQND
ncbi:MAG: hypothetical protein RIR26_2919, partial [Pseudomonadota bacterium]